MQNALLLSSHTMCAFNRPHFPIEAFSLPIFLVRVFLIEYQIGFQAGALTDVGYRFTDTLQQEAMYLKVISQEKYDRGLVTNTSLHNMTSRSTQVKGL